MADLCLKHDSRSRSSVIKTPNVAPHQRRTPHRMSSSLAKMMTARE